MPFKKPLKPLDSTVYGNTPTDNKREKALDFSRAFTHSYGLLCTAVGH